MKALLIIIAFLSATWTRKINYNDQNLRQPKRQVVRKISLQELILHKGKYHGHLVETQGFFHERFEERAIYYKDKPNDKNPSNALWIYFSAKSRRTLNLNSLQNKYVTLVGVVDTSKRGHVDAYPCSLFNASVTSFR
jgi:hypothetical protein